jgi:glycosyltransferase involved in cell wall biosynthesis
MFSILVPVCNGYEFLFEAIESVKAQSFTNWELFIGINGHGEDGGIPAILAAALAAADSRIHVRIQTTKGKVASLNDLVAHAKGDWVCLLDCDDRWEPTKLAAQWAALHGAAQGAAVLGTFCTYFGEFAGSPTLPSSWVPGALLASVNPIINSSAMIRRSLCKWVEEDLEDYGLWMRIVLGGGKLYVLPESLVWHRIYTGSAFNSKHLDPAPLQTWFREKCLISS